MTRFIRMALVIVLVAGCTPAKTSIEQLSQANTLAANLRVEFTRAADASNRAVMADTDQTSVTFAHEAEQATLAAQRDSEALRPLLTGLRFSTELGLLDEFDKHFADYRALDRKILDLAVENTNLKAQQLSFGPVQEAATAFSSALDTIAPANPADAWHVKALAASAAGSVRQIEVLQAPHIASADEMRMTTIEQQMVALEKTARGNVRTLGALAQPSSRTRIVGATAALDRFMSLNAQVISLSRANTNVKSLALALGQKRMLTATCDDSLRALQDAVSKRGFSATR